MMRPRPGRQVLMSLLLMTLVAALAVPLLGSTGASGATRQSDDGPTGATTDATAAGGQLVIATKPLEPFVFVDDDGEVSGFSIDYWAEVADRLGVEYRWEVYDTVGEIIEATRTEEADAAIAGISITRDREAVIDFSQPYYISGQQVVVQRQGSAGTFRTLASLIGSGTFLVPLLILVVLVVVVSHLVWWFERGHASDDFPYSYRAGIGEALWWSTVSVITGGEAVKNINTALSRIIALFWMLVGLFLLAIVTARATSVLTVAELENDISGLDDLAGRSVATVEGTASVAFLQREIGVIAREEPDLDAAFNVLSDGDVAAVVFDAPVVAYALNRSGRDDLVLIEPVEGRDPYGIVLPQGSDRLEEVNAAVIGIGRDGTLDRLLDEWFGSS